MKKTTEIKITREQYISYVNDILQREPIDNDNTLFENGKWDKVFQDIKRKENYKNDRLPRSN